MGTIEELYTIIILYIGNYTNDEAKKKAYLAHCHAHIVFEHNNNLTALAGASKRI